MMEKRPYFISLEVVHLSDFNQGIQQQVHWADRPTKNYNYKENHCHYITALHWAAETGRKTHKKNPHVQGALTQDSTT